MLVRDPCVDARALDTPVPEMVLNELERHAGVQEVRRDGVPQRVAGQTAGDARGIPVPGEESLDLALLKRIQSSRKQGRVTVDPRPAEVDFQEGSGCREEGSFRPEAPLHPLDDDSPALQVDVVPFEEAHFADPQAVVVDHREERAISRVLNNPEESPYVVLSQILGKSLGVFRTWHRGEFVKG